MSLIEDARSHLQSLPSYVAERRTAILLTQMVAEVERLRAIVDKLLAVVQYPVNGHLHCRWCNNKNTYSHVEGCWYEERCRKIDAARKEAKET